MADYYIDPINGNDANNGTTLTTPWRTHAHLVSVLYGGPPTNGYTVHILNDLTEDVVIEPFCDNTAFILYTAAPTYVTTISIDSGSQNWSGANKLDGRVKNTGVTWSTHVGRLARFATGALSSASMDDSYQMWIVADLGSSVARVSAPQESPNSGTGWGQWAQGDRIEIYTLKKINGYVRVAPRGGQVAMQYLDIGKQGDPHGMMTCGFGGVICVSCIVNGFDANGAVDSQLQNCRAVGGQRSIQAGLSVYGGYSNTTVSRVRGRMLLAHHVCQGHGAVAEPGGLIQIGSLASDEFLATFDNAEDGAIAADIGGYIDAGAFNAQVWGGNLTGVGCRVRSGGHLQYANGKAPSFSGPNAHGVNGYYDFVIGGDTKSNGQVPYTHASNGARVVMRA